MRDPLDSDLEDVVDDIRDLGVPEWHRLSVESARRVEDELFSSDVDRPVAGVRDVAFDGPGGQIPVRVYRPAETPAPTLVYYHGGGWTLGTLDSIDGLCRELVRRTGCLVVSVDYRLAPEHPYPAAVEDAVAALDWVAAAAPALGGDPDSLAVAGTSAGGNLAAVTALHARAFDGPALDAQLLLYPIVDRSFDTPSYEEDDCPLLSAADMRWFWKQYLPAPFQGADPFASPLRAESHAGLPPAVVVTAGHDPLRDEGVAYAEALADAGVPVDHHHYRSMAHGFLSLTDEVAVADEALDETVASLQSRLNSA